MNDKRAYAIMRIGKIRNLKVLDAVEWHNTRQIPTATVEGAPPPQDFVQMEGTYRERFHKVMRDLPVQKGKGKIVAAEFMVTASPEWMAGATSKQRQDWIEAQWRFAQDVGGRGLIAFSVQNDESTPHVQFVVVPLYEAIVKKTGLPKTPEGVRTREEEEARAPKVWRLSYDHRFGGKRDRLAALQTHYHGFVEHLGLARGRDTVGLGIKHQTLKHYKLLLTKMDRELERESKEQQEERRMLDHYDQDINKRHRDIDEKIAKFHEDQLAAFPKEEDLRVFEEVLTANKADLDARSAAFDKREADIVTREWAIILCDEAQNDRQTEFKDKEKSLTEREIALKVTMAELAEERRKLEQEGLRNREHDKRIADENVQLVLRKEEAKAEDKRLKSENYRQQNVVAQLSLLEKIFTGAITGIWDTKKNKPSIKTGELDNAEASAIFAPWPEWLARAMQRAIALKNLRSSIAQKAMRIINGLRRKRREAAALRALADKRIVIAEATEASVGDRLSKAVAAEAAAQAKQTEAELAVSRAEVAQAEADQARAAKQDMEEAARIAKAAYNSTTRETLQVQEGLPALREEKASLEEETAKLGADTVRLNTEKEQLDRALPVLRAENAKLEGDRADLEAAIARLASSKAKIEADRSAVEAERVELALDQAKFDRSRDLIHNLYAGHCDVQIDQSAVRVISRPEVPGRAPEAIPVSRLEDWVPYMVNHHNSIVAGVDRIESLADALAANRDKLAKEFPEKAPQLAAETAKETGMVNRALGFPPPGQGGVGM